MKNCLVRPTLVLVCLVLLALPLFAQRGKGGGGGSSGGGGGSTGCALITTPDLSTTTATAGGDSIGIFSRVTNCSTAKGRFTVTISAVSSCGTETTIASSVISFSGGESKLISVSYPVPSDTCKGMGSVYIRAYSGSTMLASGSASLFVQ
jgi:hypothetical protein